MSELNQLREQAEELGIEVDGRWKEGRIQEEIDKALNADPEPQEQEKALNADPEPQEQEKALNADPEPQEQEKALGKVPDAVENISKTAQMVCGQRLAVGKKYTITDRDRKSERSMKKVARAISLGLLKKA